MKLFELKKEKGIVKFDFAFFGEYLKSLKDGRYWIKVENWGIRTLNQNSFFHGIWLPIIADWMGEENPEDVCRDIKKELGYCHVVVNKFGDKKWKCESTADMSKSDMSLFLEKVRVLMTKHGVLLPDPPQK